MSSIATKKIAEYANCVVEVDEILHGSPYGRVISGPLELTTFLENVGDSFADTGLESDPMAAQLSPGRNTVTLELYEETIHDYYTGIVDFGVYLQIKEVEAVPA